MIMFSSKSCFTWQYELLDFSLHKFNLVNVDIISVQLAICLSCEVSP